MLQLNNYKLISPTTWGEILGQITDQEDLMKLLQNDTNDLKEWVNGRLKEIDEIDIMADNILA